MKRTISTAVERWPVNGSFIISRGAKTHVDVVTCEISDGTDVGRGEATPIYYNGETAEQCAAEIMRIAEQSGELDRLSLLDLLPPGAARNALDCALWDLEAVQAGKPLWQLLEMEPPQPLVSAFTISLDQPEKMEADARAAAGTHHLLKLKLSGENDRARVAAVHRGAPGARLIVDANESWEDIDIAAEAAFMATLGVELIEQPVPAGHDQKLADIRSPVPLCADESCHDRADVEHIGHYYDAINIKLDKTGGLTEALAMAEAAETAGLELMVGCMLSTSLAIRPAFLLAQRARWVDLDGPLLLARDRLDGFHFADGMITEE